MRRGLVGGTLLVASGLALAFYDLALATVGGTESIGVTLGTAAIVLEAVGAGMVAVAGPPPLDGRAARLGLAMVALGLLAVIVAAPLGTLVGPLGGGRIADLADLVFLAPSVGTFLIGASLVRGAGPTRIVGAALLASIALAVLLPIASDASSPTGASWQALSIVHDLTVVVGLAGLGLLAVRGDRALPALAT